MLLKCCLNIFVAWLSVLAELYFIFLFSFLRLLFYYSLLLYKYIQDTLLLFYVYVFMIFWILIRHKKHKNTIAFHSIYTLSAVIL